MSGLMTQNNEDGTEETDGYGKEEYDNYLKFRLIFVDGQSLKYHSPPQYRTNWQAAGATI